MKIEIKTLYNSILNDPKLLPISSFKSNKSCKYNIFPDSLKLPKFFQNNLQSQGRIIKYLKGNYAPLRAFYYQLFKLGFEIQHLHVDYYSSIIKNAIFNPNLTSNSASPISGKQYTIIQYQRILAQFMRILQTQVIPNVQLTISQYPIIDEAILSILELIVQKNHRRGDTLTQMLVKLCQVFEITLEIYENCYSFQQSDVFLYVQNNQQFYLAFLSEMAQVQSFEQTEESPGDRAQKQQISSVSYMENMFDNRDNSIYKDIRLSAGNKGTRPKIVNRSIIKQNKNNCQDGCYLYVDDRKQENNDKQVKYNMENKFICYGNSQMEKNVFYGNVRDKQKDLQKSYQQKQSNILYKIQQNNVNNNNNFNKKNRINKQYQLQKTTDNKKQIMNKLQEFISSRYQKKQLQQNQSNIQKCYHTSDNEHYIYKENNQQYYIKNNNDNLVKTSLTNKGQFLKNSHNQNGGGGGEIGTAKFTNLSPQRPNPANFGTFQSISQHQTNKQPNTSINSPINKIIKDQQTSIIKYNTDNKIQDIKTTQISPKNNKNNYQNQYHTYNYEFKTNKFNVYNQLQKQNNINSNTIPTNTPFLNPISNFNTFNNLNTVLSIKQDHPQIKHPDPIKKVEQSFKTQLLNKKSSVTLQSIQIDINFYNPKTQYGSHMKKLGILTPLTPYQIQNKYEIKGINSKNCKDQTLGTFYREFSDTKVMNAMDQPFKTNVRRTRQKFKGVRSNNWRGFV